MTDVTMRFLNMHGRNPPFAVYVANISIGRLAGQNSANVPVADTKTLA